MCKDTGMYDTYTKKKSREEKLPESDQMSFLKEKTSM